MTPDTTAEQLLAAADQKLYEVKAARKSTKRSEPNVTPTAA
jgi:hypothetical protein